MPRSMTRPQRGSIVWFYAAAPPVGKPSVAIVLNTVDKTHFDLAIFNSADATISFGGNMPFYYGTRPVSGPWCTMMRVNEPASGAWPGMTEVQGYADHGLTQEQLDAREQAQQQPAQLTAQPLSAQVTSHKTQAELEAMTKDQLVTYAGARGIQVSQTWVKADIIAAILQGQTQAA